MTITLRAVSTPANAASPGTINKPTGTTDGDLLILELLVNNAFDEIVTPPVGWQLIGNSDIGGSNKIALYYKYASSEPSSYTISDRGASSLSFAMAAFYDSGAANVRIGDVQKQTNLASANRTFPSVTPTTSADMLCCFGHVISALASTPDASCSEQWDVGGTVRSYFMNQTLASSSATGTKVATGTSADSYCVSMILTLGTEIKQSGPFFRPGEKTVASASHTSTVTIAAPDNLQVGDLMILQVEVVTSGVSLTPPSGFTAITSGSVSGTNNLTTYYKVAVVGDIGATLTVSFSGTQTIGLAISAYYSPKGYALTVSTAANSDNTSSTTTQTFASVTTLNTNSLLVFCMSSSSAASVIPSTLFELFDISGSPRVTSFISRRYVSGSQGTFTVSTGSTASKTVTISIEEDTSTIPPSGLSSSVISPTQINLSWTDTTPDETSFSIERSADGLTGWSEIATPAANSTSYSNTGLTENTIYYYRMRTLKIDTYSAYSSITNATTSLIAPSGLTATFVSESQINLSWTDNSSSEAGYKVERSPNGSTSWSVINTTAANATSYSNTGLSPSTTYYYRVRAYSGSNFSNYSSTANDTTGIASPTALTALKKLSTKITLSWTDNSSGEDGFKVERSANGTTGWSQIGTTASNIATYDDTGRTANTTYYYRVRAYKGSYNSSYTNVANATTYLALSKPLNLSAVSLSATQVRLTWVDLDLGVTGYSIERDSVVIDTKSSPPYIDVTAEAKTTYVYRIRAYRTGSTEYSSYSDTYTITTPVAIREVKDAKLFMLSPSTVFTSQVSMPSVSYPLDSISYDTGTVFGSISDIREGMTICFGSEPGLYDMGRSRIRKSPVTGILYIGRSARGTHDGEVNLSDGVYITVLDDYRVWAKIPYITPGGVTYKDSDIAVSDNTSKPPPISNCGAPCIDYVNVGTGKLRVGLLSTSQVMKSGASLSTYLWDIADGTVISGSISTNTATVDFLPGVRWIHLTVTDSNGKSHTSHTLVVALDPIPANDISFSNFMINSHSIKESGQTIDLLVRSAVDEATYPDGTMVILWTGSSTTAFARDNLIFVGWHSSDPSDIQGSNLGTLTDTTLHCVDVLGRLEVLVGLSQVLEHKTSPAVWEEFKNPTIDTLIHFVLQWQSTALDLADCTIPSTGTDFKFCALGCDGISLYEQIKSLAESYTPDKMFVCNKLGQMTIRSDPFFQELADRTSSVQTTLNPSDYLSLRYTVNHVPRVNLLGGYAFLAIDTAVISMFCKAPGSTIGQGTEQQDHNSQVAKSQDDLNKVTGHRYARLNNKYSTFSITLSTSDDLDIDPSLLTWVNLNLPSSIKASRGLTLNEARGLVKEMSIRYNYGRTGNTRTIDLTWEMETVGYPALTEVLPTVKPITDVGWTPDPVIPLETPMGVSSGTDIVAMIDNHMGIISTTNFQSNPPTWSVYTGLFTDGSVDNFGSHPLFSCVVDPFSPLYRSLGTTVRAFAVNQTGIWRIDDIFGVEGNPTKTLLYTFIDGSYIKHRTIMASFGRYFTDEADNPWLGVVSHYHNSSVTIKDGTYFTYSKDGGDTWIESSDGIGGIVDAGYNFNNKYYPAVWMSPRTPGLTYAISEQYSGTHDVTVDGTYIMKSEDWGNVWSPVVRIASYTNLGGCIHVPWDDNLDESLIYFGGSRTTPLTYAVESTDSVCTTPSVTGVDYGLRRYPFAIRAYDNDRQKMVLVGHGNGIDNYDASANTHTKSALFTSSNAGATWTNIIAPISANVNDTYPDEAAFSSDDPDVIYVWGNQYYVGQIVSGVLTNKHGNISSLIYGAYEEVLLFCGGE